MVRRKVIKQLMLLGGSIATIGSSIAGWKYINIHKNPDWKAFYSHQDLLAELTETIIPTTDTPGAKAAGVPAFIQHMVKQSLDVKSQNAFIEGLYDVDTYCLSNFGTSFHESTAQEKIHTLLYFEKSTRPFTKLTAKVRAVLIGKPFFTILRDLTIIGYCTSELGASQGLAYDHIPGAYNGSLHYIKGQKSWATQ